MEIGEVSPVEPAVARNKSVGLVPSVSSYQEVRYQSLTTCAASSARLPESPRSQCGLGGNRVEADAEKA